MKDILIVTGGSNGLGKAIIGYALNRNIMICNLDKEVSTINNENYKEFIGDISDEQFVETIYKRNF